jgi:Heterokaryon incompatibility protein (HET)
MNETMASRTLTSCSHQDIQRVHDQLFCFSCGNSIENPQSTGPDDGLKSDEDNELIEGEEKAAEPPQFCYRELLQPRAIRLLEIYPGGWADPILGHLIETEIRSSSYKALSYTWADRYGDAAPSRSIVLHSALYEHFNPETAGPGYELQVTVNCEAALRRLRAKGWRLVWIDSVCINQEDVSERNRQVMLMSQIYLHAEQILIYLGPTYEGSEEVMQFLDSCARYGEREFSLKLVALSAPIKSLGVGIARGWFGSTCLGHLRRL